MRESISLKIYNELYAKIKSHFYKPGEKLPTESELRLEYNVSLTPIRQALGSLENDGLISRQPGKGTFVTKTIKKENMNAMGGFGIHFSQYAQSLTCKTVKCEKIVLTDAVAAYLTLPRNTTATWISRVRLVKNTPVFFLNHYIPNCEPDVFASKVILSMREFLKGLGFDVSYVSEKIKATLADDRLSPIFQVPINHPLLKINRISYDQHYSPLFYEEYFVNSELWDYQIQFNAENY